MRGANHEQEKFFSYISAEQRVPADHPLRPIRQMVNRALQELSADFSKMYSLIGRPSIPPEKLLRALLLQALYSIRSERLLMEQLDYNLLFRWFVGLSIDDQVWDHSSFTKNRERLLGSEIAVKFFTHIREQARQKGLLSDEHFTVDGTLIEAWASQKSFQPKDGDRGASGTAGIGRDTDVDYRGQKRSNETHESKTDPQARLYRKAHGAEARLSYMGHVLMENRNGLVVDSALTISSGTAEREAALAMVEQLPGSQRVTVGMDKAYDCSPFVNEIRQLNATAHVAQKKRGSAIDRRTVRHSGYEVSQRVRKRVEEIFGWLKTVGVHRKTRFRGVRRVDCAFTLALAAYNLVRIRNLSYQGVAT
jgi:transposase